jgi:Protein of unknown function (DUF642)
MSRKTARLCAMLLLVLSSAANARADLVINGDFEDVRIGAPFLSSNPADIPGWTHAGTVGDALLWGVGYSDSGGSITVAGHGVQFVTLGGGFNGSGTGSWSQTITGLTAGASYNLAFDMASEGTFSGSQSITVDFPTGSSTGAMTFSAAASPANYWRAWEQKTMTFVANSTSATLRFSATTQFDVGLDFVRVTAAAVPEPSSLVLLASAAIPVLGLSIVRRRRAQSK